MCLVCVLCRGGSTSASASGSSTGRGGGGAAGSKGGDLAGATPVIIVPNVQSSLITLYNARDFVQDGRRERCGEGRGDGRRAGRNGERNA